VLTIQQVQGYLANTAQNHLKNLADQEISKQLVNGSDTQKSLMSMVQAGQILSYLSQQSNENDKICKWLESSSNHEKDSVETIFYKAEAQRLFKCEESAFTRNTAESVSKVLSTPD